MTTLKPVSSPKVPCSKMISGIEAFSSIFCRQQHLKEGMQLDGLVICSDQNPL